MHVVATAGHVDHGKSTLVLHLTGTDPDRLAEEKARGLTIDLGFAGATLPSGRRMAMIDVPGHVRFLKNMLAGMGAVDACLFVVAASEGWKPQSEEHLRILDVLGVRHGVIALTKVGLVDDDLEELARLEVEEAVEGTFLAGAPVVGVDAPTGRGLDDLRAALDELLAVTPTAVDHGRPRLWIDRSFAPAGAGTVVTGTLAGGPVSVDDELLLAPVATTVRVRAIQRLHEQVQHLEPGNRTALNLVGVSHRSVTRGDVLVRAGQWHHTDRLDASLTVLARLDHAVSRRGAYLAYIGSGEHPVQLRVLGPQPIEPGETGRVRLHLPRQLPLLPGDRYVLRDAGRGETVGGGEVLDVDPVLRASRAAPDRRPERVVAERGWIEAGRLALLT
ncbi:MAG: selenocysteine-specific translation elongation factor, partial [Acidimicrobiia bacterium]